MIVLNVYRLKDEFDLPTYGTSLSNCFDLSYQPSTTVIKGYDKWNNPIDRILTGNEEVYIYPGDRLLIPTGLVCKIEQKLTVESFADVAQEKNSLGSYSIRLHPRSGLSLKRGLILANCEGIVDVDYQEEIFVLLTNISEMGQTIKKGERIAQAEVTRNVPDIHFVPVFHRPEKHAERSGGFGSTGV